MTLELEAGRRLSLPGEGIPFQFEWRYPDAEGFGRMRARLRALVRSPQSASHHCHAYILGALLAVPDVASVLSLSELLSAVDRRRGGFDGREALVKHIAKGYREHPQARDFYLARLRKPDLRVCGDLGREPGLWDSSFVEPLVVIHERDTKSPPFVALRVLALHSDEWKGNAAIPKRLSAVVLARYGERLRRKPADFARIADPKERLDSWQSWAWPARQLGATRDPSALPLLRPFLDCTAPIRGREVGAALTVRPSPSRACDAALEAILVLLDGDVEKAYRQAGWQGGLHPIGGLTPEKATPLRDKMIVSLKQRLAQLDASATRRKPAQKP